MGNKDSNLIAESLERLTSAIDRLEGAMPDVGVLKSDGAALKAKLTEANRHNEILREAANRVAAKLDSQIGRLSNALKD